jgi:hypothetical protein
VSPLSPSIFTLIAAITDAPTPTPEQIRALGELLKAVGAPVAAGAKNPLFEWLPLIGDFVAKAGWPIVVILALLLFRKTLLEWESVEVGGAKVTRRKIARKLEAAGKEAPAGGALAEEPTKAEQKRAAAVARLAADVELTALHQQAMALAWEYERTRASLPSGADRTQKMEVIVAKMRAIGRAIFPLRYEFMASAMPGTRLLAIAAMQVLPDYENLDWLVDRLKPEKPFIGYHAAVALVVAARASVAANHKNTLVAARNKLATVKTTLAADTDRGRMLASFETLVNAL